MGDSKEEIGLISEQGDMGLFFDPLNDHDKKIYEEQKKKKSTDDKSDD